MNESSNASSKESSAAPPVVRDDSTFDGRLPPPFIASVETTMFCNLRCPMCIQFLNGTTVSGPHMEGDVLEKIAAQVFPLVQYMQPSVSGEPLMTRGFDRMLDLACTHGVRVDYTTNGTLLTPAMIRKILPTLGRIFISFDGATAATFEKLRTGASFEKVVANIRELVAAVRELPDELRPIVGLNCTLMRSNVEELPALVELAHELGADMVNVLHVWAVTREMQWESLAHHLPLAEACIRRAAERARELGIGLTVNPLDGITTAMADSAELPDRFLRAQSATDEVATTAREVRVHMDRVRPLPLAKTPSGASPQRDRREAIAAEMRPASSPRSSPPSPVWICDYLWNKVYIGREGAVSPCCVPGIPVLGNLLTQSFEEVWNGEAYRAMRRGMAAREPASCCRGCQFIRELTTPAEIDHWLHGRRPMTASEIAREELPQVLRPVTRPAPPLVAADARSAEPPEIRWQPHAGAEQYEVELSLDDFANVAFSTTWHGLTVTDRSFRVPAWAWVLAPIGKPVAWRALAVLPRERAIVATGVLVRMASEPAAAK